LSQQIPNQNKMEKLVSLCRRRGFIFPSSEIYGGLSSCWDYGPLGVELLRNVRDEWWQAMTYREDIEGIDAAILMHPRVWEASGHVENFTDPMVDCRQCKARYRIDVLVETISRKVRDRVHERVGQMLGSEKEMAHDDKIITAALLGILRGLDPDFFAGTHVADVEQRLEKFLENPDSETRFLNAIVYDKSFFQHLKPWIHCPNCGNPDTFTEARQFNLMFRTFLGSVEDESSVVYLRPETAQGIYVNYLNVMSASRQKLPFGIAQVGKAFRNEINTKNFLFRTREFEQMEMQYFVKPGTDTEWFHRWREERMQWFFSLGLTVSKLRWHQHEPDKLAHYAKDAYDIEYEFPFGWGEIEGVHNRTDYDLSRHEQFSGKSLKYFDEATKERFIPFIIETSAGLSRSFMAFLVDALREEEAPTADGKMEVRTVLSFHPRLAPIKAALFPLVNRDGMPEFAREIEKDLRTHLRVFYDDSGAVGRRYRRQDEVGTPFCITVDSQTLQDRTVTVRDRDSMQQVRISADQLRSYLEGRLRA
jgi:glycyl-tRNA synthetase